MSLASDTEAELLELGWNPDGSDGEDDDEEMDNSEPLEDSDVVLSDSGKRGRASCRHSATLTSSLKYSFGFFPNVSLDDDLEGYDKTVSGRRKTGRVCHCASCGTCKSTPCFWCPRALTAFSDCSGTEGTRRVRRLCTARVSMAT